MDYKIEYLQNKMAAYQLYDTGITVAKEDELLSLLSQRMMI